MYTIIYIHCYVARYLYIVDDREVSSIQQGLCVLLGIARDDTEREAEWM